MRKLPNPVISWAGVALIAAACATGSDPLASRTEYDTLVPGWESKFTLDWKAEPGRDGTSRIHGRVSSRYGQHASPFRVLGMAVDPAGKVIGQRIGWVHGGVPGFGQAYFEIDRLPAAASYRVTVWDYTFIEAHGALQ